MRVRERETEKTYSPNLSDSARGNAVTFCQSPVRNCNKTGFIKLQISREARTLQHDQNISTRTNVAFLNPVTHKSEKQGNCIYIRIPLKVSFTGTGN